MMVFIGDDSDRDDNNRTAIYSLIYRDGKWSEPMQIEDDGAGWTEPKAFITDAANVSESDLYLYGDKAYYVFTTNAYSDEGVYKLYTTSFDGSKWSEPMELLDNKHEDSHPAIAVEQDEPVVFWNNDGMIYKVSLKRPFGAEIIINSNQAEDILELSATNTEQGIALAWTEL